MVSHSSNIVCGSCGNIVWDDDAPACASCGYQFKPHPWIKDLEVGETPEEVKNPYSGETVILDPLAVAVYDMVKGAEEFNDWHTLNEGLSWFMEHRPAAYMVLLD